MRKMYAYMRLFQILNLQFSWGADGGGKIKKLPYFQSALISSFSVCLSKCLSFNMYELRGKDDKVLRKNVRRGDF